MDLGYGYDGAGNVTSLTNTLDSADSKSMAYDGLDRLVTAGVASISYDMVGNIISMRTSAGDLTYAYSNNRLSGVSGHRSYTLTYDAYGNVTGTGRHSFVYDDASNLRSVSGAASASYDYDGKNLRVRAQRNGKDTYFFYSSQNGNLLGRVRHGRGLDQGIRLSRQQAGGDGRERPRRGTGRSEQHHRSGEQQHGLLRCLLDCRHGNRDALRAAGGDGRRLYGQRQTGLLRAEPVRVSFG